jgi:hypothetical protein
MNIMSVLTSTGTSLLTVTLIVVVVIAVVILYALYKKGDVTAVFALNSFTFTLDAKDRRKMPKEVERKVRR